MSCLPVLPAGFEEQTAWGFHDPTGRFSYALHRVYGLPATVERLGTFRPIDEALSYWSVSWSSRDDHGDERVAGRWMTFDQARKLSGARLSFARFTSPGRMRDELPALLRAGVP